MEGQITNFTSSLWAGLTSAFTSFMNFIPALLGAIVILVGGWFVSKFIGLIVERVLTTVKIEDIVESAHIGDYLPQSETGARPKLSAFIGGMSKWFVFLIFVQASAITLGVAQITNIINSIILFIPNIVVAVVILVIGAWAARAISGVVAKSTSRMNLGAGANTISALVRYGILGFALIAAVSQLGIATSLINILFTGLVASLALAFGLAFGLGGQSAASDFTRSLLDKGRSLPGPSNQIDIDKTNIDEQISH